MMTAIKPSFIIKNLAVLLLALCFSSFCLAKQPLNLKTARNAVIHYYTSGEYNHDLKPQVAIAQNYLEKRVHANHGNKKLAITLDIDDTVICNFKALLPYGIYFNKPILKIINKQHYVSPIIPMRNLYRYALDHHVAVFFISARPAQVRADTIRALHENGYETWTHLYLRPAQIKDFTAFKTSIRKQIRKEGYDIILNVGDHPSDLGKGTYADKVVLLPNPMY